MKNDIDFAGLTQEANPGILPAANLNAVDINGCGFAIRNLRVTSRALFPQIDNSKVHDLNFDNLGADRSNQGGPNRPNLGIISDVAQNTQMSKIQFRGLTATLSSNPVSTPASTCGIVSGFFVDGTLSQIGFSGGSVSISDCQSAGVVAGVMTNSMDMMNYGCSTARNTVACQEAKARVAALLSGQTYEVSDIHVAMDNVTLNRNAAVGGLFGSFNAWYSSGASIFPKVKLTRASFTGALSATGSYKSGANTGFAIGVRGLGGLIGNSTAAGMILDQVAFRGTVVADSKDHVGGIIARFSFPTLTIQNSVSSGTMTIADGEGNPLGTAIGSLAGYSNRGGGDPINSNNNLGMNITNNGATVLASPLTGVSKLPGIIYCHLGGETIPFVANFVRYATSSPPPGKTCFDQTIYISCMQGGTATQFAGGLCNQGQGQDSVGVKISTGTAAALPAYNLTSGPVPNIADDASCASGAFHGVVPSAGRALAISSIVSQSSTSCTDSTGKYMKGVRFDY